MGICSSCFGGPSGEYSTMDTAPDPEARRRQMAEAAEKRLKQQEGRGVKDPEALKQKQKRLEELERKQALAGGQQEEGLRWQVG